MGGEEYEWVNEAMKDYCMVAELLIRLKHSDSAAAAAPTTKISVIPISTPFEWGVRLPRSRQIIRCSNNNILKKDGDSSTRASPTTPLSWSGGTSVSGCGGCGGGGYIVLGVGATTCGGDGYEDSSKLVVNRSSAGTSAGRSKGNGTNEPTNRRSRKKKTFAELKELESSLLKERIQLKRELVTLQVTLEEEKAKNTQLKRMKLKSQLQSAKQPTLANVSKERLSNQACNIKEIAQTPASLPIVGTLQYLDAPAPAPAVCPSTLPTDPHSEPRDIQTQNSLFELPDLNLPIEEDSGSEVLYGMS